MDLISELSMIYPFRYSSPLRQTVSIDHQRLWKYVSYQLLYLVYYVIWGLADFD